MAAFCSWLDFTLTNLLVSGLYEISLSAREQPQAIQCDGLRLSVFFDYGIPRRGVSPALLFAASYRTKVASNLACVVSSENCIAPILPAAENRRSTRECCSRYRPHVYREEKC